MQVADHARLVDIIEHVIEDSAYAGDPVLGTRQRRSMVRAVSQYLF